MPSYSTREPLDCWESGGSRLFCDTPHESPCQDRTNTRGLQSPLASDPPDRGDGDRAALRAASGRGRSVAHSPLSPLDREGTPKMKLDQKYLDMLAKLGELSAEEIIELNDALLDAFNAAAADERTTENVAYMAEIRDHLAAVGTETTTREDAQAELDAQGDALIAEVNGASAEADGGDGTGDGDGDAADAGDAGDGDAGDAGDGTDAGDAGSGDGAADAGDATAGDGADATADAGKELQPAAGKTKPASLAAVKRRQSASSKPKTATAPTRRAKIKAGAGADLMSAGDKVEDMRDVGAIFADKLNATVGGEGSYKLARFDWSSQSDAGVYGPERRLGADSEINETLIAAATSDEALDEILTAAGGGLCAPTSPYYDILVVAETDRPVRDGLVGFEATRGGINGILGPVISDFAAGIVEWTAANDANPTAPATKPVIDVACGTPYSFQISAIPLRLRFGNMGARTYPEQSAANVELGLAAHARFAETLLLAKIDALGVALTAGGTYGAARELLKHYSIMAEQLRNKHRAPNRIVRMVLPAWTRALIRTDIARQMPTDTTENALKLADAEIDSFFAVRKINVTWHLDGAAGEMFANQAAGALVAFPTTVKARAFFEGSLLFLDGGTLDIGIYRDSALNAVNKHEMFFESFETVAKVSPTEVYTLTSTVTPTGAASALVTPA